MTLLVQKFGGSSLADPDRIRNVADYVARRHKRGDDLVLVVSAMGKETDELLRLASEVSDTRPGREMDVLITGGERKTTALVCMALHDLGVPADSFTGSQAGFITDTNHTKARILDVQPDRVRDSIAKRRVAVVGGSQGVSADHDITFLGRGGSDTTAVALAHALGAVACELYTDVSGVFTADPRVVDRARRMDRISFDEMLEMCASGCPKPAMRSVEFARTWHVPLHVRSSFTWEPGTWIIEEDPAMEDAIVSAVTHEESEAKVTVTGVPDRPGIAATLFRRLADAGVNVDMIMQNVSRNGVANISFTVPQPDLEAALKICDDYVSGIDGAGVAHEATIGKVSLVGAGMKTNPGVAAKVFETLAEEEINIEMISTSAIRISCVVPEAAVERAVQVLHTAFGLDV